MTVAGIVRLLRDKRAVSAVISNLILIGAVIVVGFAVLFWAQYQSSAYTKQYSGIVGADISQLQENIVSEYIFYNRTAKTLSAYVMNAGTVGNVNITTAYVSNSTWASSPFNVQLKSLSNPLANIVLNATQEGTFTLSSLNIVNDTSYSLKIVTARGSSFVYSFAT